MTDNEEHPLYKNITITILSLAIIIAIIYIYYQRQHIYSLATASLVREGIII